MSGPAAPPLTVACRYCSYRSFKTACELVDHIGRHHRRLKLGGAPMPKGVHAHNKLISWPDIHVEQLRALWARGVSARKIVDALGCEGFTVSRNAVIGKARRLGLERHPTAREPVIAQATRPPQPAPDPSAGEFLAPNGVVWPGPRGCLWPIGDPREPGFRFCRVPKPRGAHAYCAEHARKGGAQYEPTPAPALEGRGGKAEEIRAS